ncbi:MAG: caspase family protein [Pseudomonadota bacterium]
MWRALFVGIDSYPIRPLRGCVADAMALEAALNSASSGGSPRWKSQLLLSEYPAPLPPAKQCADVVPNFSSVRSSVRDLLLNAAEPNLLFYFSGHSDIDFGAGVGALKTIDTMTDGAGLTFYELMQCANRAATQLQKQVVIILDTCHAGAFAQHGDVAHIGTGLTVLAGARGNEHAIERNGQGVFTQLLVEGLNGTAADIAGKITAASLFAYVDAALTLGSQRAVFKSNVHSLCLLKQVEPQIPKETLLALDHLFKDESSILELSPAWEPTDRADMPAKYAHTEHDTRLTESYLHLRKLDRSGLLEIVGADVLFDAAMQSQGCRLTSHGKYYWRLVKSGNLAG